jgi:hypothetical protein
MNQQVVGQVTALEPRQAGWVAVHIHAPGKQYPIKLSTKKAELLQAAQQLIGQVVTAGYTESQSENINPNSGQPYINRYLEAITMGQVDLVGPTQLQPQQFMPQQPVMTSGMPQQPQPQQFVPQPQPVVQQQPVQQRPDLREVKIHRQTAAKVAVQLLEHLDPEERNLSSLLRISEQLVKYFDEGVQWAVPPFQPQPQQDGGGQYVPSHDHDHEFERPPVEDYGDVPY